MYKISMAGQAEVFFPSFEVAINHLGKRVRIPLPIRYIQDIVESGNTYYIKKSTLEKVNFS